MPSAVWMIRYDLDTARADEYLHWFHEIHIAEKLARPGYTWAAHYRVQAPDDSRNYIALFGGRDSRVFYDPSPAQIKPRQTPETRAMMACRRNSHMLIVAEEWVSGDPESQSAISADWIQLALFDANDNEEQLGAWLVQDYLATTGKSGRTLKFLASTGNPRHLLIHESADSLSGPMLERTWTDWAEHVSGYLSYPAGGPLLAQRVWPTAD